jgi:hypothetical protein
MLIAVLNSASLALTFRTVRKSRETCSLSISNFKDKIRLFNPINIAPFTAQPGLGRRKTEIYIINEKPLKRKT